MYGQVFISGNHHLTHRLVSYYCLYWCTELGLWEKT